jgi:hypothetical protein
MATNELKSPFSVAAQITYDTDCTYKFNSATLSDEPMFYHDHRTSKRDLNLLLAGQRQERNMQIWRQRHVIINDDAVRKIHTFLGRFSRGETQHVTL